MASINSIDQTTIQRNLRRIKGYENAVIVNAVPILEGATNAIFILHCIIKRKEQKSVVMVISLNKEFSHLAQKTRMNFSVSWFTYLHNRGIPTFRAFPSTNNQYVLNFSSRLKELTINGNGTPFIVISKLPGTPGSSRPSNISPKLCYQCGVLLAKMRINSRNFDITQKNTLFLPHWLKTFGMLLQNRIPHENSSRCPAELIHEKITFYQQIINNQTHQIAILKKAKTYVRILKEVDNHFFADEKPSHFLNLIYTSIIEQRDQWAKLRNRQLESGPIHGDPTLDNFFIQKRNISGIGDPYNGCNDSSVYSIYDLGLAIAGNCLDRKANPVVSKIHSFINGYFDHITPTFEELESLPTVIQTACLYFLDARTRSIMWPLNKKSVVFSRNPLDAWKAFNSFKKMPLKNLLPRLLLNLISKTKD